MYKYHLHQYPINYLSSPPNSRSSSFDGVKQPQPMTIPQGADFEEALEVLDDDYAILIDNNSSSLNSQTFNSNNNQAFNSNNNQTFNANNNQDMIANNNQSYNSNNNNQTEDLLSSLNSNLDFDETYEQLTRMQKQNAMAEVEALERIRLGNSRFKPSLFTKQEAEPLEYPSAVDPFGSQILTETENTALLDFINDFFVEPNDQNLDKLMEIPQTPSTQFTAAKDHNATRTRKTRKKLLSEQEKRLNHTSSEKKRRSLIKSSFDNLVDKLPLQDLKRQNNESKKRGKQSSSKMSKFVVLDIAGKEIQSLLDVNAELKNLCLSHGISV